MSKKGQCVPTLYNAGDKLGEFIFLEEVEPVYTQNKNKNRKALFKCKCGNEKVISISHVKDGHTKSCGCDKGLKGFKHGLGRIPESDILTHMKARCNNPKNKSYSNYGGRGIKVCERWDSIENFIEDMGRRPSDKHSIDRIDNDGDYCKENCRWVTRDVQNKNKRNNILYEYNGEYKIIRDWANKLDIAYHILRYNLYDMGRTIEEVLNKRKNVNIL